MARRYATPRRAARDREAAATCASRIARLALLWCAHANGDRARAAFCGRVLATVRRCRPAHELGAGPAQRADLDARARATGGDPLRARPLRVHAGLQLRPGGPRGPLAAQAR